MNDPHVSAQEPHLHLAGGLCVFTSLLLEIHHWNKAPNHNGRTDTRSQLMGSYGTFEGGKGGPREGVGKSLDPDQQGAGVGAEEDIGPPGRQIA